MNNLNYIGVSPLDPNITNWSLKSATLEYLKRDVDILFDAINLVSNELWEGYSTDITKNYTIAGLTEWIYYSKFYNATKYKLANITGPLGKEFRESFYGGITRRYANELHNGYAYDMVSQYPAAMLEDMPIGTGKKVMPVKLDDFFGFVYCDIVAPSRDVLPIPTLPYKPQDSSRVVVGRGEWRGLYFSEELKDAIKLGYKVTPVYGYEFERGKDVFKDFVTHMFKLKSTATNPVKRQMSKLLLNSFFGRLGMKQVTQSFELVSNRKLFDMERKGYDILNIESVTDGYSVVKVSKKPTYSNTWLLKVIKLANKDAGSLPEYNYD